MVKLVFIVFFVYIGSLFFREEHLPVEWVEALCDAYAGEDLVVHIDSVSFGFRHGLCIRGLKVYDGSGKNVPEAVISADSLSAHLLLRRLVIHRLKYVRLPSSYYRPGNSEKNERVGFGLPDIGRFSLTLVKPEILGIAPETLDAEVLVWPTRLDVSNIRLQWPDLDEKMTIGGYCLLDLNDQLVDGEIEGLAKQAHIRPLLVALDVPVALPYMDGFTDVVGSVPSRCGWKVQLVNNDFDLYLDLAPKMGKYRGVPMKWAKGKIHLHNFIRGNFLNYRQTIGPITAEGLNGEELSGTVVVAGTNGYNTVDVDASGSFPVADFLKIGGFTGDYVGNDVTGKSNCKLQFRFPRSMTNNYEVLNGEGHITIKEGKLMRMKGFRGLLEHMPSIAPAISWFTDSTQASCDYVIENGILKSDNIYIEGTMFSIMMYGTFDTLRNNLDFTVRVQFSKKDSLVGKIVHPLTWPFTKLLLEFKLTGSPENPQWKYISVVDRVMEAVW